MKWDPYDLSIVDHLLYLLECLKDSIVEALDRLAKWVFGDE